MRRLHEPDPRLGPRAKIERAKVHLAEFKREIDSFIASSPYKFRAHVDPDGTKHLILDELKPLPLQWSAIVGDIIHNARTALDLLSNCSGRLETKTRKEFPFRIYRSRAEFEAKAFDGFGQNCPRTVRFLKLLKSFDRRNDAAQPNRDLGHHANTLVVLNRLSNSDKHELIIPVGTAAGHAIVTPAPGFGGPFQLRPEDTPLLQAGEVIITFSPFDPLFANKKFETMITTKICLGGIEGQPFISAHAFLRHAVEVVDRIIGIAERRLFR